VPVKALREYEDLGLIYTVGRSAGNYRLFDEEALWCRRDRYPAGTGVDVGRDQQIRAQIDLFGVGHAAPWQTAARAHNGGYRTSSLEQRQLQNVTAERWPLAPDRRISAGHELACGTDEGAQIILLWVGRP
jgi:hypothetical protein